MRSQRSPAKEKAAVRPCIASCLSDLRNKPRARKYRLRTVAAGMPRQAEVSSTDSSSTARNIKTERNISGRRSMRARSEEHTSELQSLMRISYAVFCLKKKKPQTQIDTTNQINNK